MKSIKKYGVFIVTTILIGLTYPWNNDMALKAIDTVKFSFKEIPGLH